MPMTDTTPLQAIARLCARDDTDNSFLTDISQTLGAMVKRERSDRWKQKLREELVREHFEARQKKEKPVRSLMQRLIKPKSGGG